MPHVVLADLVGEARLCGSRRSWLLAHRDSPAGGVSHLQILSSRLAPESTGQSELDVKFVRSSAALNGSNVSRHASKVCRNDARG